LDKEPVGGGGPREEAFKTGRKKKIAINRSKGVRSAGQLPKRG